MKILVLTSRFPYPPVGGDKLRAFNLIRHLAERFDVDVFSLYSGDDEISSAPELRKYCRALHLHRVSRRSRIFNTLTGWLRGLPLQTAYYTDAAAMRAAQRVLKTGQYDGVVVHLVRMLEYTAGLSPDRIVLEYTDAISMNYRRIRRPSTPRELLYVLERSRLLRYEIDALRRVSRGVLVAREDADYLQSHGVAAGKLVVVRNGTSLADVPPAQSYHPNRIVFLGNMRTTQNEDMCLWFIREIFPFIRRSRADAEFLIAGANPSKRILKHDGQNGVVVAGPVTSPAEVLASAAVSVCPMRYGAGLQNKVLESMAVGVPVVATPCGAEGIGAMDGREILVAETAEAFAVQVLRVMDNPELRESLAKCAALFIRSNFRWEAQMQSYASVLRQAFGSVDG